MASYQKQDDCVKANDCNQSMTKDSSTLDGQEKPLPLTPENTQHDETLLQSAELWDSGDFSLTSIETSLTGKDTV
jgi:hypothetical protein